MNWFTLVEVQSVPLTTWHDLNVGVGKTRIVVQKAYGVHDEVTLNIKFHQWGVGQLIHWRTWEFLKTRPIVYETC